MEGVAQQQLVKIDVHHHISEAYINEIKTSGNFRSFDVTLKYVGDWVTEQASAWFRDYASLKSSMDPNSNNEKIFFTDLTTRVSLSDDLELRPQKKRKITITVKDYLSQEQLKQRELSPYLTCDIQAWKQTTPQEMVGSTEIEIYGAAVENCEKMRKHHEQYCTSKYTERFHPYTVTPIGFRETLPKNVDDFSPAYFYENCDVQATGQYWPLEEGETSPKPIKDSLHIDGQRVSFSGQGYVGIYFSRQQVKTLQHLAFERVQTEVETLEAQPFTEGLHTFPENSLAPVFHYPRQVYRFLTERMSCGIKLPVYPVYQKLLCEENPDVYELTARIRKAITKTITNRDIAKYSKDMEHKHHYRLFGWNQELVITGYDTKKYHELNQRLHEELYWTIISDLK